MKKITIPKGAPSKTVVSENNKTETTYYRDGHMLVKSKCSGYGGAYAQPPVSRPPTANQVLQDLIRRTLGK